MRAFEDAPPVDCPACGAPTTIGFIADARCPACDVDLVEAAAAARAAIATLQLAVRDLPALPPRLQASLKARLFEFDQDLDAALIAAEPPVVDPTPAAPGPVVAPVEQPVSEPLEELLVDPVPEPIAEPTAPEPVVEPTEELIAAPVVEPTEELIAAPVVEPTEELIAAPVVDPTEEPVDPKPLGTSDEPVAQPSVTEVTPPAKPVKPAKPGLWQRLGPAFAENLMFFLGGFLLLAGALYFVSTAWTTMTGASQLLVIEGGILCFGAALVGAGRLLNRDGTLDDLDRVLATAGGACTAFAALAVGRLLHTNLLSGFGGLALWIAAGFAINTWSLRRLGLIDRRVTSGLILACLGAVIVPIFMGWPVALAALSVAIATAVAWRQDTWPVHALAVIAAGVAVTQIALHTNAWGVLALPLAGAAIVYSRQARALTQAHDLFAVGMAIAAFVIGLLSPNAALICAAAGCVVAARASVHRERVALLVAAFVLGLAAYVLLPAPIRGIVLALKAKAAAGLGYSGGRLPLAWYGVTCLPYVALCGVAAHRLAKRGLDDLARIARGWTLGIAAGLCLLAFTTMDLRAPLMVLPAEGFLLLGLAFWLSSTRMAHAAPVLLAAAPILAVIHLQLPTSVVPLGIAAIALALRVGLPKRGPVVHAVYQSCACLLAGAAGMAIVPPAFMDQAAHWIDLIAAPLLVFAIWPLPQLRPLALLALHRMVPALVSLTGIWAWPAAIIVAVGALFILRGYRRDRLRALSGWAIVGVAVSGGLYTAPFGIDATIGLLGVAAIGIALAWGTGQSTLAAVGLLALSGAAASVAWIFELRPSRIGMSAAVMLSLGVVALGWLHRRRDAIFARIGRAPTRMAVALAGLAVLIYVIGDAQALIKKRSLITLGAGVFLGMAAAPRLPKHAQPWMLIGGAAAWLFMRGVLGVLPWAAPAGLAAMGAASLFCALLRWAPRALPAGDEVTQFNWRQLVLIGLVLVAASPPAPIAAIPLLIAIGLCIWRRDLVADTLGVSAVALLVAGPIVTSLLGAEWAPVAVFVVAMVGWGLRRFAWAPRSTGALALVAVCIWGLAFGPDLLGAVVNAQIRPGAISVGISWIAAAATAWLYLGRTGSIRLAAVVPLLWWAPIAGLIGDGPARAAPSIAALALIACAVRTVRPSFLWTHLAGAAVLTFGVWDHVLTPVTGVLIAATLGVAGWRYGRTRDAEATPVMIAVAGVVGVVWNAQGAVPLGQVGIALAAAAIVAGATRRYIVTVWLLAGGAIWAATAQGIIGLNLAAVIAGGLATAALGLHAWRNANAASREAATVVGATAAAMAALWIWPEQPNFAGLAILATVCVAAVLRCFGVTVGILAGIGALVATISPTIEWPGLVAGVMLAGVPWIVWWRRRASTAIGGAMFALAAATVLWCGFAHACQLDDNVLWLDAMWAIAAVAGLAAYLKRSTLTVAALVALPILLTDIDQTDLRSVLSMCMVAGALALHGRRQSWSFDAAFGPLAYAAALAVGMGLGTSFNGPISPWIAAAIGGVTVAAALAGRRLITLVTLAVVVALFSELQTQSLGAALGGLGTAAAFAIRAWRSRHVVDETFAWVAAPIAATGIVGWLLNLPADLPLLAYAAGFAGLTSAVIARRRTPLLFVSAGLVAFTWASMLFIGAVAAPIGAGGLALILGTAALLFSWAPRLDGRPKAVHALIAVFATLHLALAQATPWLSGLAGHHIEVWIVIAAGVAATGSFVPDAARKQLLGYFLAIPVLAILSADDAAGVTRAAFLGSITLGFASRDRRALRYVAFALANVGAWAFCLTLDLVDPTLYGLPPGLTLLALAEVERSRLSPKAHLALLVGGFALAYGGMAVQIVTVGGALHAALLLAAGLVSVGFGWRARRADLLIGGTAAVVLDVICYLVRHGFQQNFISAGLLLFAGATVLLAATVAAKMRRSAG